MNRPVQLSIAAIRTDGGTQPRAGTDWPLVAAYADDIREGAIFPPVTVFFDGTDYWLADGFHRTFAAQEAGQTEIDADVKQGTRRDAVLHSVGANAIHGLRRTNDDKRQAVVTLLTDSEWGQWSDNEIARRCAVSQPFVGKIRASLKTVISDTRTYTDKYGNETTMNTSNIGRYVPPEPQARKPLVEAGRQQTSKEEILQAAMIKLTPLIREQCPGYPEHMKSVCVSPDGQSAFVLMRVGMFAVGEPSYGDWLGFGVQVIFPLMKRPLANLDATEGEPWWIGDWLNFGKRYGEQSASVLGGLKKRRYGTVERTGALTVAREKIEELPGETLHEQLWRKWKLTPREVEVCIALAAIPNERLDMYIAEIKASGAELTEEAVLALALATEEAEIERGLAERRATDAADA